MAEIRDFSLAVSPDPADKLLTQSPDNTTEHQTRQMLHTIQSSKGEYMDTEGGNFDLYVNGVIKFRFNAAGKLILSGPPDTEGIAFTASGPEILSSGGAPSAIAAAGSVSLDTNGVLWVNTDGTANGWEALQPHREFIPILYQEVLHGITIIAGGFTIPQFPVGATSVSVSASALTLADGPLGTYRFGVVADAPGAGVTALSEITPQFSFANDGENRSDLLQTAIDDVIVALESQIARSIQAGDFFRFAATESQTGALVHIDIILTYS